VAAAEQKAMRICEVLGYVTLSRVHPTMQRMKLLLAAPYRLEELEANTPAGGEALVVVDELGAGIGSRIAVSEGREAAMPFHPERKPVDAYCACILDQVCVDQTGGQSNTAWRILGS
jgi:microcompartment protein CcmK/EutM